MNHNSRSSESNNTEFDPFKPVRRVLARTPQPPSKEQRGRTSVEMKRSRTRSKEKKEKFGKKEIETNDNRDSSEFRALVLLWSSLVILFVIIVRYQGGAGMSVIDELYFCMQTFSTIGFGDVGSTNFSSSGKIAIALVSLIGTGMHSVLLSKLAVSANWNSEVLNFCCCVIFGALSFSYLEGWDIQDSFYYVIVMGTTVGYGDMVTKTDQGKVFCCLYSFWALYSVTQFTGSVTTKAIRFLSSKMYK
jgi:Ion channel